MADPDTAAARLGTAALPGMAALLDTAVEGAAASLDPD